MFPFQHFFYSKSPRRLQVKLSIVLSTRAFDQLMLAFKALAL